MSITTINTNLASSSIDTQVAGSLTIGGTNATSVTLGGASALTSLTLGNTSATPTILIDTASTLNTDANPAIAIGTSSSTKTIKINNASSSTHISGLDVSGSGINNITGGSGLLNVANLQTTGVLNIANNASRSAAINIGQYCTGQINIGGSATAAGGTVNIGGALQPVTITGGLTSPSLINAAGGINTGTIESPSLPLNLGASTSTSINIGHGTTEPVTIYGLVSAPTSITTPSVDTSSATTLSIGTSAATGITLGKTGVAVTIPGTLSLTGLATETGDIKTDSIQALTNADPVSLYTTDTSTISIGSGSSATTVNGTLTASAVTTCNGGLTIGGTNNITLGSGAVGPVSGQLGYTISTTSTNLYTSTGFSQALCNGSYNAFSDNSGQGIQITAGTWVITYTVQFTTDNATVNWIKVFNTYIVAGASPVSYGTYKGAQIFQAYNPASNILPLSNSGDYRPCGSGTLVLRVTASTYIQVQYFIGLISAQAGNLVIQSSTSVLSASRIA